MKCHQCSKPAMFLVGPDGQEVPLCLDCNAKFQDLVDRQQINNERIMNHLADEFDMVAGMPGFSPKYPPRAPRTIIQGGSMTLNHITVNNSNIGVLNTGRIGEIDSAIGVLNSGGDGLGAEAFQRLTEGLVDLSVDDALKGNVLEILSVLAAEATVPKPERRKAAMQPLLVNLATLCSGVAGLAQLYAQFAPAIESLFK